MGNKIDGAISYIQPAKIKSSAYSVYDVPKKKQNKKKMKRKGEERTGTLKLVNRNCARNR